MRFWTNLSLLRSFSYHFLSSVTVWHTWEFKKSVVAHQRSGRWLNNVFGILLVCTWVGKIFFALSQSIWNLIFECHTVTNGPDLRKSAQIFLQEIPRWHLWHNVLCFFCAINFLTDVSHFCAFVLQKRIATSFFSIQFWMQTQTSVFLLVARLNYKVKEYSIEMFTTVLSSWLKLFWILNNEYVCLFLAGSETTFAQTV